MKGTYDGLLNQQKFSVATSDITPKRESPWTGDPAAEASRAHLRITHLEGTVEWLLERVAFLEKDNQTFREAHDSTAKVLHDVQDKLEAVHMRVFPEHAEFVDEVRKLIGPRNPPHEKG